MGADPDRHHALVDGAPDWMAAPVREWVRKEFVEHDDWSGTEWNVARMRRHDLAARRAYAPALQKAGAIAVFSALSDDQANALLDWLVFDNAINFNGNGNDELDAVLSPGGSRSTHL